ncbi:MAG: alpha/beta fold hydrolase [Myxococcota bacterium]
MEQYNGSELGQQVAAGTRRVSVQTLRAAGLGFLMLLAFACGDPSIGEDSVEGIDPGAIDAASDADEAASADEEKGLFNWGSSGYSTKNRSVTLPGGDVMHYTETGPADGKTILLVHGYPTSAYLYRNVVKEICGDSGTAFRCVAPSHIGFGDSSCPGDGRSVDPGYEADRIEEFIDVLDLQDFALVVHDWGGPIGMAAGLRDSDRMTHLVILNTFLRIDGPILSDLVDIVDLFNSNGPALIRPIYPDFIKLVMQSLTNDWLGFSVRRNYAAPYREWGGVGTCRLRASLNLFGKSDEAEGVAQEIEDGLTNDWAGMPTLFLWGEDDPLLGPNTQIGRDAHEQLAALVPQADTIIIEDANHFMQEDQPEEIGREIANFVGQ